LQGRKYLDYDLESLHVFLNQQQQQSRRVVVAFQDSEAFESGLLTDLITLFQYVYACVVDGDSQLTLSN
jgi:origin recognition complex subunit 3